MLLPAALWTAAALAPAALLPAAIRAGQGLAEPGGSDPGMWEAGARALTLGQVVRVAPLFPWLAAVLAQRARLPWDLAGWILAWVAFAALGPATFWLARGLGASPWLALLAVTCVCAEPWLASTALQCQPDSLTALVLVLTAISALAWRRAPTWPRLGVFLLAVGLLPLAREHAPLALPGLFAVLLARGTWRRRALHLALAVASLALAPALVGQGAGFFWDQAWFIGRWTEAGAHLADGGPPPFVVLDPGGAHGGYPTGDGFAARLGVAWASVAMSLRNGHSPWLWLLLGGIALLLLRRHRLALLAVLLPVAAVPAGAIQARHVAVLAPVAVAAWTAAHARFGRLERAALVGCTLLVAGLALAETPRVLFTLRDQVRHRAHLRALAEAICAATPPDALVLRGDDRVLTMCQRQRAHPGREPEHGVPVIWVTRGPDDVPSAVRCPGGGWQELSAGLEERRVFVCPAVER